MTCSAWPDLLGELGRWWPVVTVVVRCDLVVRGPDVAPVWPSGHKLGKHSRRAMALRGEGAVVELAPGGQYLD
jgi:hypothetical protein